MHFVHIINANHDHVIEVHWELVDKSVHVERYTVPPRITLQVKNPNTFWEERKQSDR
jgi:hypothetical protein